MRASWVAAILSVSGCVYVQARPLSGEGHPKPKPNKLAETARWLIHESTWGVMSTISTTDGIVGAPFGNPQSLVDGPYDGSQNGNNGTGIPYFYVSDMDVSQLDLVANPMASITVSEAQLPQGCSKTDPEDPTCVRLTLTGEVVEVTDPVELDFAKTAIFQRHPAMENWPTDHNWRIKKLNVRHLFILDFYGGAKPLSVEDYLAANGPSSMRDVVAADQA